MGGFAPSLTPPQAPHSQESAASASIQEKVEMCCMDSWKRNLICSPIHVFLHGKHKHCSTSHSSLHHKNSMITERLKRLDFFYRTVWYRRNSPQSTHHTETWTWTDSHFSSFLFTDKIIDWDWLHQLYVPVGRGFVSFQLHRLDRWIRFLFPLREWWKYELAITHKISTHEGVMLSQPSPLHLEVPARNPVTFQNLLAAFLEVCDAYLGFKMHRVMIPNQLEVLEVPLMGNKVK